MKTIHLLHGDLNMFCACSVHLGACVSTKPAVGIGGDRRERGVPSDAMECTRLKAR